MATVATKLMTAEEFYDWANRPENEDKSFELERGKIVELSRRPGKRQGLVCANAGGILRNFVFARKKGYVCTNDTGLVAVEVLSPNDTAGKMNRRIREQLVFGVKIVWLLDPEARNVTIYRLGQDYRMLEENEELTGDEVLPDFRCKVSEFFDLPGQ